MVKKIKVKNILLFVCFLFPMFLETGLRVISYRIFGWLVDTVVAFPTLEVQERYYVLVQEYFYLLVMNVLIEITIVILNITKVRYEQFFLTRKKLEYILLFLNSVASLNQKNFHKYYQKNEWFARLNTDVDSIVESRWSEIIYATSAIMYFLWGAIIFSFTHWVFFLIFFGIFLLKSVLMLTIKGIERKKTQLNEMNKIATEKILKTLDSFALFFLNNKRELFRKKILDSSKVQLLTAKKYNTANQFINFFINFLGSVLKYAVVFFIFAMAFIFPENDQFTVGTALVFSSMFYSISQTSTIIVNAIIQFKSSRIIKDKFLSWVNNLKNKENKKHKKQELLKIKEIMVKNLNYRYNHVPILKNLSCTFRKGHKYLITGLSGSGKTTFLKILLKMIDVDDESLTINGTPYKDIDDSWLRKKIAFFPSENFIFDDTVLANVSLWNDNIDVRDTLIKMNLNESFFQQNATLLSQGQKQRICLARTLLLGRDVVILDEPFTNLDDENIKTIKNYLFEKTKDKILIIVSHKTSLIQDNFENIINI